MAQVCIDSKVNMVTTSYVSDAMQGMHGAALDAGITSESVARLCPVGPGAGGRAGGRALSRGILSLRSLHCLAPCPFGWSLALAHVSKHVVDARRRLPWRPRRRVAIVLSTEPGPERGERGVGMAGGLASGMDERFGETTRSPSGGCYVRRNPRLNTSASR